MATIQSQITLNDGISGVLKKITSALDTTLDAFERVQRTSGRAVDISGIAAPRTSWRTATAGPPRRKPA